MNSDQLPSEEVLLQNVNKVLSFLGKQNQAELGWIYSATRQIKGYPGHIELNRDIQHRVDHAVGGLAVVYLFAMLDDLIPRKLWKYGSDQLREKMYAYLHIRNTVAHGFDGSRAERYGAQFNSVMKYNPLPGVKNYSELQIELESHVWTELSKTIQGFLSSMLHQVINYGYNDDDA